MCPNVSISPHLSSDPKQMAKSLWLKWIPILKAFSLKIYDHLTLQAQKKVWFILLKKLHDLTKSTQRKLVATLQLLRSERLEVQKMLCFREEQWNSSLFPAQAVLERKLLERGQILENSKKYKAIMNNSETMLKVQLQAFSSCWASMNTISLSIHLPSLTSTYLLKSYSWNKTWWFTNAGEH